ncbi:MAG: DUF2807 domain-containing protein, partial [Planctomycetes bacterium]|nr:DUF2807 domain-containing protein [Planctomycetota bacterium]
AEIVPAVSSRLSDLNQAETEARAYEYRDFSKLYIGADMDVTVRRGDRFAIAMSGRARDLDRLNFRIEDGQLQILESRYPEPGKFCLFCFSRPVRADITLPALSSFVAFRTATVNLIGFESDLYISLGESARAELALNGQDIECRLSGVNSRLELSGPGGDLACSLDGYSRLTARELSADNININGSVFSRVSLDGETRTLTLELKDYARLEASDFTAGEVSAETDDFSQADVRPGSKLKAMAGGQSRIIYRGEPAALETDTADFGRIEAALDLKLDKNTLPDAGILTEPD